MDIFWGTMEYDEVFLQHHASQRHVQDGGDVIPEVGVHLDFIFHRLVIHHLEELRHHWQTLQRAVWFYTVGPFCIQNFFCIILFQIFGCMLHFYFNKWSQIDIYVFSSFIQLENCSLCFIQKRSRNSTWRVDAHYPRTAIALQTIPFQYTFSR